MSAMPNGAAALIQEDRENFAAIRRCQDADVLALHGVRGLLIAGSLSTMLWVVLITVL